jgi:hypothetical protein
MNTNQHNVLQRLRSGITLLACSMLLAACGGGGGNPGAVSGGSGGSTVGAKVTVALVNGAGAASSTLATGSDLTGKATVVDGAGKPVANAVVAFTTNTALASISPSIGTALTDSSGVANVLVRAASSSVSGAGTLSASVVVAGATLTGTANYAVAAATPAVLTLSFINASGVASNSVSSASPLTIKALVTDKAGAPIKDALVSFATEATLGTIAPTTGTSLTDATGVALATLRPASLAVNGAGKVTASITMGGATVTSEANYTVLVASVTSANVAVTLLNASGQPSNSVSSASPLTARAMLTDKNGLPIGNALVNFATDNTLAVFSPSVGTTLSDANGIANITLRPASLAASGAGRLTASTTVGGVTLVGEANYMVGATALSLSNLRLDPASIAAYGSTVVSIDVLAGGVKYTDQQMNVTFSSACVAAGKATFATTVATSSGTATAVFRDQGCANNDVISASVAGVTQPKTATLTIATPAASSIQFISATPVDNSIVIKGQGGINRTETATLKFKVFDIFNNPLPGKTVSFTTTSTLVTINKASDSTDQNGEVITTVNSGTTPTTFRVRASLDGGTVSTLSDSIVVTTGQPVARAMSISVAKPNIEGWSYDSGTSVPATTVTVLLADTNGNPVADGTPITFQTNMGAVGSSSKGACNTVNGGCTVDFRTQDPRNPAANTPATPCNATGGSSDATRVGLATVCSSTTDSASVLFKKIGIFFSGSFATNVYMNGSATALTGAVVDLGNIASAQSRSFTLHINDINNNPMPSGSTVTLTSLFNTTAIGVAPATVGNVHPHNASGLDDLSGNNVTGNQGSYHLVTISSPLSTTCTGSVTGTFNVTVTTPRGNVTSYPFTANMTCP